MDAENASLKERLDDDDKYENELKAQMKEMERKEADLESKVNWLNVSLILCFKPDLKGKVLNKFL